MGAFRASSLFPLYVIIFISAIAMLPVWWFGLPVNAHDTKAHASWQYFFSLQLWEGDLYPRWLAGMNEGFGSPSFYIYPPLSQYAAAILAPFSDSAAWVYQRLGIAATAAYLIGGVGAYLWFLKVTQDRISALLGSIVFLLAPYHLLTDTYIRAAYAELWAFAWAPFSLLAVHLFRENLGKALIMYTGATAALLLSHAPSCIALLPAYVAYAAVLSVIYKDKRIVLWTLAATFLAVLVSGGYLGTALTHQKYINSASLFSGYYDFFRWFLLSEERWPSSGIEMVIAGTALTQCGAAALFGFIAARRAARGSMGQKLAWFSIFISFAILFMVSVFSKPIWGFIPLIQKIQFPWRLFTTQTAFLALACALFVQSVRSGSAVARTGVLTYLMGLFIALLIIINAGLIVSSKPGFIHSSPLRVRDTPEYHLGSINGSKLLFEGNEKAKLIAGKGSVKVEVLAPRYIRLHVDAETDMTFIVRHFNYPEWRCTTPAGQSDCKVGQFEDHRPIITVSTTPGTRTIELELSTTAERVGYLASIIGILLVISLCLIDYFVKRNNKRRRGASRAESSDARLRESI